MTAPVVTPIQVYAPPGEDPLLTVPEVCQWLRITRMTLHDMNRDDQLKPIKVRGSVRYPLSLVRAYLDEQARAA